LDYSNKKIVGSDIVAPITEIDISFPPSHCKDPKSSFVGFVSKQSPFWLLRSNNIPIDFGTWLLSIIAPQPLLSLRLKKAIG
jgi:hypothetical protein